MAKPIKYLVIHCTATPEGREVSSEEIRKWHTGAVKDGGRGWKQVGYTDMIHLDGRIERLVKNNDDAFVDDWEVTNGVANMNSVCRHIVYVGGLAKDGKTAKNTLTDGQKNALIQFLHKFRATCPTVKIVGHNELAAKACPSFNVQDFLKEIKL